MKRELLPVVLLLAAIAAGCTPSLQTKCGDPYTKCISLPELKNFDPVPEDQLPAELAAWKEHKPRGPGAVSAVVGDSLYVMASFGTMNYSNYGIEIKEINVLGKRVQVKAYFSMWSPNSVQAVNYPKAYGKVPVKNGKELPVELILSYDSAAFARVPRHFDEIDPELLPSALRHWKDAPDQTLAAVVGDYLYVRVNAGDRMKPGYEFRLANLELDSNRALVTVILGPAAGGVVNPFLASPQLIGRIRFDGAAPPPVKVEYHAPQGSGSPGPDRRSSCARRPGRSP